MKKQENTPFDVFSKEAPASAVDTTITLILLGGYSLGGFAGWLSSFAYWAGFAFLLILLLVRSVKAQRELPEVKK